jgi:twitching motility protein PilI
MATSQTPQEVISILKDIEQRSKQRAAGLSSSEGLHTWTAISYRVAEQYLLTPLQQSKEIFPVPQQITPVPKAANWVYGIANLRGELLPIFDLKRFLTQQPSKLTKHSRIMVLNSDEIYCGVLVDEVFGLKHFEREPAPIDNDCDKNFQPFLNGTVFQNDILWHLFSLIELAKDPRFLNAAA